MKTRMGADRAGHRLPGTDAWERPRWYTPGVPALVVALLTVPVVLSASIALEFLTAASGGRPVTGSGTATASMDFGTISKYGALGTNLTRSTTTSDYTISTNLSTRVTEVGEGPKYSLRARIVTASVFTWKVGATVLSTTLATIASNRNYNTTYTYALQIVIPDAQTTGLSISQDLEFLAIAN